MDDRKDSVEVSFSTWLFENQEKLISERRNIKKPQTNQAIDWDEDIYGYECAGYAR